MAILESGPILIVIVVVILLFGATQIPKLARSLGRAKGEFAKAKGEFDRESVRGEVEAAGSTASDATAKDDEVRKTARSLGIDDAGKSIPELKRLIQQKLA